MKEVRFISALSVSIKRKSGAHASLTEHTCRNFASWLFTFQTPEVKISYFSSSFVQSYRHEWGWWWLLPLKKKTSPDWSCIILAHPPCCASLKLGCFHDNQVFDGQICVWCPVCGVSFPPSAVNRAGCCMDLACLDIDSLICSVKTHKCAHAPWCGKETVQPVLSISTFRCKFTLFLQPIIQILGCVSCSWQQI